LVIVMRATPFAEDFALDHPRSTAGFTLIELMVTLAVVAALMAVGTPSFRSFTNNQAIRSASFDLNSALTLARSEAVKRNGQVTIARRNGNWSLGWTVTAADGTVVQNTERASNRVTASNATASVTFNQSGRVAGNAVVNWELETVPSSNKQYRCITLDPAGMPRVSKEAC